MPRADFWPAAQLCLFQTSGSKCLNQPLPCQMCPKLALGEAAASNWHVFHCFSSFLIDIPPRLLRESFLSPCLGLWPLLPTYGPEASYSVTFWGPLGGINFGTRPPGSQRQWDGKVLYSVKLVHLSTEEIDILPTFYLSAIEGPSRGC